MENNDAHKAYYGITEVIYPPFDADLKQHIKSNQHINEAVVKLLVRLERVTADSLAKEHRKIKLFDSFFSDTLEQKNICRLMALGSKGFSIQIMLFDPFSNLASSRAGYLDSKSLAYRANCGILGIKKAIIDKSPHINDEEKHKLRDKLQSFAYLYEQLGEIESHYEKNNIPEEQQIKIRYTHVYTEAPTYIIGDRVFKGHFFINKSSAYNPWICSIDDISRPHDLYFYLNYNFRSLWESGHRLKDNKRNVFIGYDHDLGTLSRVEKELSSMRLNPVRLLETDFQHGHLIDSIYTQQQYANGAIFIMSDPHGDGQTRTNVATELANWYAKCRTSEGKSKKLLSKTILILEESVQLSNWDLGQLEEDDDIQIIRFTRDQFGPRKEDWQKVERALKKLQKLIHGK